MHKWCSNDRSTKVEKMTLTLSAARVDPGLLDINRALRASINNSMGLWKTNGEANFKLIAQVTV